MNKYFYTFSLTLLFMTASIAYLIHTNKNKYLIRSLINRLTPLVSEVIESLNEYDKKYENYLSCNSTYSQYFINDNADRIDYTNPAPPLTHELRMTRAVLVYFPIDQISKFKNEFKWLYRSWIEMQKNEPVKWRTSLVVFIQYLSSDQRTLTN